jgi:nitronate monooxygenase
MGTRFLASPEAKVSDCYRNDVVRSSDGGVSTTRTSVYDKVKGTTGWPESYNARGVVNHSFWNHEKGMAEDENRRLYEKALKVGDAGWGEKGRTTAYAGTGVGLISEIKSAGRTVQEVQEQTRQLLGRARNRL